MFLKFIIVINFLLFCDCEIFPERRAFKAIDCRSDEIFSTCGRSCHPTCEVMTEEQRYYCTKECVIGCFCAADLYRDEKGNCVTKEKCPNVDRSVSYNSQEPDLTPESRAQSSPSEPIDPDRTAYSADKCRADEEFKTCGSPCDDTCTTVVDKSLRPCTLQCLIGCFCKKPLVRDENGNCVQPSECPGVSRTIPGTRFTTSRFRPTTETRTTGLSPGTIRFPFDSPNEEQTVDNTPGDRKTPSTGVQPSQRPANQPICLAGEFYTTCGNPCPDTCETIVVTPAFECPRYCIAGCFCKPGYVRDPRGNCIPKEQCENFQIIQPQQQPENFPLGFSHLGLNLATSRLSPSRYVSSASECRPDEEFNICGSDCLETCEARDAQCSYNCVSGCFCRVPLIRAIDGSCIPKDQCPKKVSKTSEPSTALIASVTDTSSGIKPERYTLNKLDCRSDEEFKFCGSACSGTCSTVSNPQFHCGLKCVIGCFCKDSLVRTADGSCIPADQCPISDTTAARVAAELVDGKTRDQGSYPSTSNLQLDTGKTNYPLPSPFQPNYLTQDTDNSNYPLPQQPNYPIDNSGKTNYPAPKPLQPEYPRDNTGKTNYPDPAQPAARDDGKTRYPAPKPLQPNYPTDNTGKTNYPDLVPPPVLPNYPTSNEGKTNYQPEYQPQPQKPGYGQRVPQIPDTSDKTNYQPGTAYGPARKGFDGQQSKVNFRSPADSRRSQSRFRNQARSYDTKSK